MAAPYSLRDPTQLEAARRMSILGAPAQDARDWSCEMIAVASGQDRDSFMRIYDHFMPRLCVYLRGLGTPEAVAEELAQECLLRLWQHAASYDPRRSAVSTWVFRIARNLYIDRARRLRYQAAQTETLLVFEMEPEPSTAEGHADSAVLERRIEALSPVQARLIRMSYFEAKSHQDIASELGLPLGTVKSHLRRAFLRLQGELGGEP